MPAQRTRSHYLYRILSYRHVVDLFRSKELHFTAPRTWEDPYEQWLEHSRSHAMYAQCWGLRPVSDAMWRIYSSDRTAVRIRTSFASLSTVLDAACQSGAIEYFIKEVEYCKPQDLRIRLQNIRESLQSGFAVEHAVKGLCLKRDAFDHETEVRIIVHDCRLSDSVSARQGLRISVDPHAIVDSIMFDPRADNDFMRVVRHYLRTAVEFKGDIGKSLLYRPPFAV